MNRKFILTAILSLFGLIGAVSAQENTSDFAGVWTLDTTQTKLAQRVSIESMTMNVRQTGAEINIKTTIKTGAPGNGKGTERTATQNAAYTLDGTENSVEIGSGAMAGKETRSATIGKDGKLVLIIKRSFTNRVGGAATKISETWELADAGKTLKVRRYTEIEGVGTNAELYFRKNSADEADERPDKLTVMGTEANADDPLQKSLSQTISGGVLNGKATDLVVPKYPAAARAVKAGGTVNVQVVIDEQGSVVSASAVSGHPLLRSAAEQAARQSKFSPTVLNGLPVMVTGIIVYNFTP